MDLAGVRLILLEDDRLIAKAFEMVMEAWGCRVDLAYSLDDLAALLARPDLQPDILISDYRLPGGRTGVDALALARQSFASLPAIMITGDPAASRFVTAADCLILQKPVQPEQIRAVIERMLAARDRPT